MSKYPVKYEAVTDAGTACTTRELQPFSDCLSARELPGSAGLKRPALMRLTLPALS